MKLGRLAALALAALGLAGLSALVLSGPGRDAGDGPRTVVLIAVDDLRRDHLGAYGAAGAETPNLDALAAEGSVYDDCVTASTATNAAVATLLTGLHPWRHGLRSAREIGWHRLTPSEPTLAEGFRERGFSTVASVSLRQLAARTSGLARGFDAWRDEALPETGSPLEAEAVIARLLDSAAPALSKEEPLFLFLHLGDLRGEPALYDARVVARLRRNLAPFEAEIDGLADVLSGTSDPLELVYRLRSVVGRRRGTPAWEAYRSTLYASRVATLDRAIGRLFDALRTTARWPDATVVLVGTRGRYVAEGRPDGELEGFSEELIRVPLVIKRGGAAPARVDSLVGSHAVAELARTGRVAEPVDAVRIDAPGRFASAAVDAVHKLVLPFATGRHVVRALRAGDGVVAPDEGAELDAPKRAAFAALEDAASPPWGLELALQGDACAPRAFDLRTASPVQLDFELLPRAGLAATRELGARSTHVRVLEPPPPDGGRARLATCDPAPGVVVELPLGEGPIDEDALALGLDAPLSRAPVPRLPDPFAPAWDVDEQGAAPPWVVDVSRADGPWLDVRVHDPALPDGAPVRLYAAQFPPDPGYAALAMRPGTPARLLSSSLLASALVVQGPQPLQVAIRTGANTRLALAVSLAEGFVPAAEMRYLGRRFCGETQAFYLPPWLPERSDWLVDEAGPEARAPRAGAPTCIIGVARPGVPPTDLDLTRDEARFLHRLGSNE